MRNKNGEDHPEDAADARAAREIARSLEIPSDARGCIADTDLYFRREDDRLALHEYGERRGSGLAVDFETIDLRRGTGNLSRQQPLARAFGRSCTTILDATAGLGHDAFLLAGIGYRVTAFERNPVVAALLEDGLRRALESPEIARVIGDRLAVFAGDARVAMAGDALPPPDAVYLDPMYPEKRKRSALARKSIRLVRELVGDDPDAEELLVAARRTATRRVVVKRPLRAPALGGGVLVAPDTVCRGKLVRYDVYLVRPGVGNGGKEP